MTVYDTGPIFRGGANAAQSIVLPYLRHRAIEGIDRLVVSHADLDHSGGVSVLAASVPIAMIMRGESFAGEVSPTACEAGDRWSADGVEFAVLWPQRGAVVTGNNASCVVQLTAGSHRLLLTGDIERDAEQQLVRQGALQPVAVVVVPHHGSATSSTAEFVRSLRPELAIVSAGFGNRWNLPDAEVVRRWQDAGARILSTATDGAVSLRLCRQGGVSALRLSREAKHRIWHE